MKLVGFMFNAALFGTGVAVWVAPSGMGQGSVAEVLQRNSSKSLRHNPDLPVRHLVGTPFFRKLLRAFERQVKVASASFRRGKRAAELPAWPPVFQKKECNHMFNNKRRLRYQVLLIGNFTLTGSSHKERHEERDEFWTKKIPAARREYHEQILGTSILAELAALTTDCQKRANKAIMTPPERQTCLSQAFAKWYPNVRGNETQQPPQIYKNLCKEIEDEEDYKFQRPRGKLDEKDLELAQIEVQLAQAAYCEVCMLPSVKGKNINFEDKCTQRAASTSLTPKEQAAELIDRAGIFAGCKESVGRVRSPAIAQS